MRGLKYLFLIIILFVIPVITEAQTANEFLLQASENGDVDSVLKALQIGATVDAQSEEGVTPLMYASQNGHLDVCRVLIFNGADINHFSAFHFSPLLGAVKMNRQDIADTLIHYGAFINAKDIDSVSSLHYAVAYGYYIMADMLLFYGADVNAKTADSTTALMLAAMSGDTAMINLLISKKAVVDAKDKNGFTALMVAAQNDKVDAVKFLLDQKANINQQNKYGYSALTIALERRNKEMIKLLLEHNADPNQRIEGKITPLKLSCGFNDRNTFHLLKKQGAKDNILPYFHELSTGMDLQFNFTDILAGLNFGVLDAKYNTGFNLGYATRIGGKRILYEQSPDTIYQFWEKRSMLHLNFEKRFALGANELHQEGFFVGVKEVLTYGHYIGSEKKPETIFLTVPQVGLYFKNDDVILKLNYEYVDLRTKSISPHRIVFSLAFLIKTKPEPYGSYKKITWL